MELKVSMVYLFVHSTDMTPVLKVQESNNRRKTNKHKTVLSKTRARKMVSVSKVIGQ